MKLNNLQILRGISALLVCCFHFRDGLNFNQQQWGDILFKNGSVGVPIFFVISGYIMVFSTKKIEHSNISKNVFSFYKKRFIRILPLYYLLTFMWIVMGGAVLYYLQKENTDRLIYSLLFLPQKNEFPVLYLGWSLNFEMFFYFIFAISLLFKNYRYFFVVLFFISSMIFGMVYKPENAFLQMITGIINIYFIIGIFLGLYIHKIPYNKTILLFMSFFSTLLFTAYFFDFLPVTGQFASIIAITFFVIAFLLFDLFLNVKANSFLKMLGDISYSIYLSHPFVEIFFRRFTTESPILLILLFIAKLAVVIVISKILYELIEKRLTQILKKKVLPQF